MLNSTVAGRIDLTPELMILQVKPDVGVPNFVPGQYVALGLPGSAPRFAGAEAEPAAPAPDKLIKRVYSISSSLNQIEEYGWDPERVSAAWTEWSAWERACLALEERRRSADIVI